MFDFQPRLVGDLLTLRPYRPEDWEALLAAASDPLIWEQHPILGNWRPEVYRAAIDTAVNDRGGLVAIDNATGGIIGFSRYSTAHVEEGEIEIGWTFLARRYWGGDHNREMKRLMLAHALATWPVVVFRIGAENLRSRRALEKIGGTLLTRTRTVTFEGREILHVCYAITREAFETSPIRHAGGKD